VLCLQNGGITDAVPFSFMEEQGYRRNVIVLTQLKDYRKGPASGMAMMKLMLRKYPSITDGLSIYRCFRTSNWAASVFT